MRINLQLKRATIMIQFARALTQNEFKNILKKPLKLSLKIRALVIAK
jgi:hypothetical protein